jgi:hypothetical protein
VPILVGYIRGVLIEFVGLEALTARFLPAGQDAEIQSWFLAISYITYNHRHKKLNPLSFNTFQLHQAILLTEMAAVRDPDVRTRLAAHFESVDFSKHGEKWNELYKENFLPWDKGFPSPALVDILTERQDIFPKPQAGKRLKALVPGVSRERHIAIVVLL